MAVSLGLEPSASGLTVQPPHPEGPDTLVDVVGIEPTLPEGAGLQSAHDPYVTRHPLERATRIALVYTAWKAALSLELSYPL